jgi:hypothetical protein
MEELTMASSIADQIITVAADHEVRLAEMESWLMGFAQGLPPDNANAFIATLRAQLSALNFNQQLAAIAASA